MHTFFQDLRYALRMLRKNSLLTAVMVASLSIGIGANSAIFSVVDALLLRPLPYPHPDRLAAVWLHSPAIGVKGGSHVYSSETPRGSSRPRQSGPETLQG